jgi:hypothetical protein
MAIGTVQINVSLVVKDQTYGDAETLRTQIETFIASHPEVELTIFQITEAP